MKHLAYFAIAFISVFTAAAIGMWILFAPPGNAAQTIFIVPQQSADFDVPARLAKQGLIKHESAFRWLYMMTVAGSTTAPGGYRLDGSMHAWRIIKKLTASPDLVWVKVREGLRKEQIGLLLQEKLGWTDEQVDQWNSTYADSKEYREGVYYPDTYLFPKDEAPMQIAERFIVHFNETIAPYLPDYERQNILWTTAVTIASLIERETNNRADMPIIAAVIWNRLDQGMRLQIDATVQYAMGNEKDGWWPVVKGSDTRTTDSPYNTYMIDGLPPGPIANPGKAALEAVANPSETACMFYLHSNAVMHCAETYEEHVQNIKKYLY